MNKYLFSDGINGVKELQSQDELQTHIDNARDTGKIRIWIFSSNEWISYAIFEIKYRIPQINKINVPTIITNETGKKATIGKTRLKKFLFVIGAAAGVFLIFNFTKLKWTAASPVKFTAARPVNVPMMDIDSLIKIIENDRGLVLDRNTRTNLRLRNTWPDRIVLMLNAERETSNAGSRFFNVNISIDNSTGFNVDNAIVKLRLWKNNKVDRTDTLLFNNIRYDKLCSRQLKNTYRGDSIVVSFESIRARSFNFCYSALLKNNTGNYSDRWYCHE
jgi:hypothetical protein